MSKKRTSDSDWIPPDDMPPEQVRAVKAGRMCGAPLRKAGGYCKNPPAKKHNKYIPYRCKAHGAQRGGKPGNMNNLRHGLYAKALLPGEAELLEGVKPGNLDWEIRITKLRLMRALNAEKEQIEKLKSDNPESAFEVYESNREVSTGADGKGSSIKRTQKSHVVDFNNKINSLINQLVKLENQRYVLMGGTDMTPEQRAHVANNILKELSLD